MTTLTPARAITLRAAAPADESLLRRIFEQSRSADFSGFPAGLRPALVDMQYRAQQAQYSAQYPEARHEVILVDGAVAGRILVDESGTAWRLIDISVSSEHRNGGIGTAVLSEVCERASASGRPVELSVWAGNRAARRLYERLGFSVAAERPDYLSLHRAPDALPSTAGHNRIARTS
ncbi:GNAT family N-acetyltransferase [Luethyella okanaganae]|uniref:GNAT family N-acetyltransferase n=1 Tax=Luethyella okanaganae TaxID=69372 RepID=A0ABW1VE14_9MICO